MRVYLPSTLTALRGVVTAGQVGSAPLAARAVTPALRGEHAGADEEELEYAAMSEAARDSVRLLAADAAAPPRRVVLAADVPDGVVEPRPGSGVAGVRVTAVVPLARVGAVHVDDAAAEADVRAAVAAVRTRRDGAGDDTSAMEAAEGHELLWFATQEVPALLAD